MPEPVRCMSNLGHSPTLQVKKITAPTIKERIHSSSTSQRVGDGSKAADEVESADKVKTSQHQNISGMKSAHKNPEAFW